MRAAHGHAGGDPACLDRDQAAELSLVGGPKFGGKVLVEDMILDGNIGLPVLETWVVTLDLANERAWIAPAGKP